MSYRLPFSEYRERVGTTAADYTVKLAEAAKNVGCEVWRNYPDWVTQNKSVGSSFARGIMTSLCDPDNPPPPTIPVGCDTKIHVFGTYTLDPPAASNQDQDGFWRTYYRANVNDFAGFIPEYEGDFKWFIRMTDGSKNPIRQINRSFFDNELVVDGGAVNITFYDSSGDGEGTPSQGSGNGLNREKEVLIPPTDPSCATGIQYPVSDPPPSLPYRRPVTIFLEDNSETTFNVEVKPTGGGGGFLFPLEIVFGKVEVNIDVGGFTFNFGTDTGNGIGDEPNDSPAPLPPGDEGGSGSGTVCLPLPSPNSPEGEGFYDKNEKEESEGEDEEELDEILDYIQISITERPSNAKKETGFPGQDVIYPGYIYFKSKAQAYPRTPIHFGETIYRAPDGADGYTVRFYPGFKGVVVEFTRKPEPEE